MFCPLQPRRSRVRIDYLKPLCKIPWTSCSLIIICEESNGKPLLSSHLISFPGGVKANEPAFGQRIIIISSSSSKLGLIVNKSRYQRIITVEMALVPPVSIIILGSTGGCYEIIPNIGKWHTAKSLYADQ